MNSLKAWLREWLGIGSDWRMNVQQFCDYSDSLMALESKVRILEDELATLKVARYVPPQTPEPEKPKIIKTRTWKEFSDIMEREAEEMEPSAL